MVQLDWDIDMHPRDDHLPIALYLFTYLQFPWINIERSLARNKTTIQKTWQNVMYNWIIKGRYNNEDVWQDQSSVDIQVCLTTQELIIDYVLGQK